MEDPTNPSIILDQFQHKSEDPIKNSRKNKSEISQKKKIPHQIYQMMSRTISRVKSKIKESFDRSLLMFLKGNLI